MSRDIVKDLNKEFDAVVNLKSDGLSCGPINTNNDIETSINHKLSKKWVSSFETRTPIIIDDSADDNLPNLPASPSSQVKTNNKSEIMINGIVCDYDMVGDGLDRKNYDELLELCTRNSLKSVTNLLSKYCSINLPISYIHTYI